MGSILSDYTTHHDNVMILNRRVADGDFIIRRIVEDLRGLKEVHLYVEFSSVGTHIKITNRVLRELSEWFNFYDQIILHLDGPVNYIDDESDQLRINLMSFVFRTRCPFHMYLSVPKRYPSIFFTIISPLLDLDIVEVQGKTMDISQLHFDGECFRIHSPVLVKELHPNLRCESLILDLYNNSQRWESGIDLKDIGIDWLRHDINNVLLNGGLMEDGKWILYKKRWSQCPVDMMLDDIGDVNTFRMLYEMASSEESRRELSDEDISHMEDIARAYGCYDSREFYYRLYYNGWVFWNENHEDYDWVRVSDHRARDIMGVLCGSYY